MATCHPPAGLNSVTEVKQLPPPAEQAVMSKSSEMVDTA
jgi:hypothetical protein